MDVTHRDEPPRPGLRERKKARTRALIQEQALRLFRDRGYEETSVEDIAEAAEVSPSTVFRYFPTKPDLVIYDDLDERMIEGFRAQPAELDPVQALRASLRSGFAGLAGEEMALQLERERLMRTVPELRAAMLGEFTRTLREIADLVAERTGRPANDDDVLALAGAVIGLSIAAWLGGEDETWTERFLARIDRGMALLESGFHF
ncbi:MAG: TetR family transcriptional regulator [Candidatus Limnocylindrales bacterium]